MSVFLVMSISDAYYHNVIVPISQFNRCLLLAAHSYCCQARTSATVALTIWSIIAALEILLMRAT